MASGYSTVKIEIRLDIWELCRSKIPRNSNLNKHNLFEWDL